MIMSTTERDGMNRSGEVQAFDSLFLQVCYTASSVNCTALAVAEIKQQTESARKLSNVYSQTAVLGLSAVNRH
jgi:hypothetical protein